MRRVRISFYGTLADAGAFSGAVAARCGGRGAVELHQLLIVHIASKRAFDFKIGAMPVASQLHTVGEVRRQIVGWERMSFARILGL